MTKEQAVQAAAAAVLDHGGPLALTDPKIGLQLMGEALDLGATHRDITDEMKRQRGAE
jgi:hypothetical protein